VVIKPVPPGATIVGVPAHIAEPKQAIETGADLEHGRLPDPVLRTLSEALGQHSRLEERIQALERALAHLPSSPPLPVLEQGLPPVDEAEIRDALREVIDPEVGVNVVDLGMIRNIAMNGRGVEVRMVLMCPECPLADYLIEQVRRKAQGVAGGEAVTVMLLNEAWNWSDAAPRLIWGDGI
jgi:serine O-acetyltransferase